jgi:hypothetical protein
VGSYVGAGVGTWGAAVGSYVIGVGATVAAARSNRWSSTPSSMNFFEMWKDLVRRCVPVPWDGATSAGASSTESNFPTRFSSATRLGVTAKLGAPPSRATTAAARISQRIILVPRRAYAVWQLLQALQSIASFQLSMRVKLDFFDWTEYQTHPGPLRALVLRNEARCAHPAIQSNFQPLRAIF